MKQVNDATASTLENFRRKTREVPWEMNPYAVSKKALMRLGKTEWDEEHKKSCIAALAMWVTTMVGSGVAQTLNEIVDLMRIAAESGTDEHKKAADEMAASMNFVECICKCFLTSIDFEYIAEQIFEDGVKTEKEREAEFAAAEAAKAKVKAHAEQQKQQPTEPQPKTGTLHTRWNPSVN